MAFPSWVVKLGASALISKFKERAKKKAMESLKGKLTYAGAAVVLAPLVGQVLGFEVAASDIGIVLQAAGVIAVLFGKWRANRNYGQPVA